MDALISCCFYLFAQILNEERELQRAFRDELMCMMHLQVLALISAEARLQREASLRLARIVHALCSTNPELRVSIEGRARFEKY